MVDTLSPQSAVSFSYSSRQVCVCVAKENEYTDFLSSWELLSMLENQPSSELQEKPTVLGRLLIKHLLRLWN